MNEFSQFYQQAQVPESALKEQQEKIQQEKQKQRRGFSDFTKPLYTNIYLNRNEESRVDRLRILPPWNNTEGHEDKGQLSKLIVQAQMFGFRGMPVRVLSDTYRDFEKDGKRTPEGALIDPVRDAENILKEYGKKLYDTKISIRPIAVFPAILRSDIEIDPNFFKSALASGNVTPIDASKGGVIGDVKFHILEYPEHSHPVKGTAEEDFYGYIALYKEQYFWIPPIRVMQVPAHAQVKYNLRHWFVEEWSRNNEDGNTPFFDPMQGRDIILKVEKDYYSGEKYNTNYLPSVAQNSDKIWNCPQSNLTPEEVEYLENIVSLFLLGSFGSEVGIANNQVIQSRVPDLSFVYGLPSDEFLYKMVQTVNTWFNNMSSVPPGLILPYTRSLYDEVESKANESTKGGENQNNKPQQQQSQTQTQSQQPQQTVQQPQPASQPTQAPAPQPQTPSNGPETVQAPTAPPQAPNPSPSNTNQNQGSSQSGENNSVGYNPSNLNV